MSDHPAFDAAPPRRAGRAVIVAAVVLAFLAGLALMAFAMSRFGSWWQAAPATPAAHTQPVAALATDPLTLATRESALAAQLADLESRAATLNQDAAAASGQANRAEAMMVAFAARRAIDRGIGLGYVEQQLRQRFGASQPRAAATIIAASRAPVTLEMLSDGLDALAPRLATRGDGGWLDGLTTGLGDLVVLRRAGTPSPLPAERLARARRMLDMGQVESAAAEVARMPGAGAAANWRDAAARYVAAHHALDAIEAAAIEGQAAATGG